MLDLLNGRSFQVWEYRVSLGFLLIRSPITPDMKPNIDIICAGVEYMALPTNLGEITISDATEKEIFDIENIIKKKITVPTRVWVMENSKGRFPLVAAGLQIKEFHGDIFESSLPLPPTRSNWKSL